MNRDRSEGKARAYIVELAEASPLPPPFPEAASEDAGPPTDLRGEAPRGIAVAAFTFILIVGVAAAAWWFASAGRQTGLGTNVAGPGPTSVVGTSHEIAVVAADGTVLRGRLWSGGETGIIVAPGYSDDAADAELVAESLAQAGHTVLFFHLRGQRPSGGLAAGDELPGDLRAVAEDLRTRGVDNVYVVAYRQSATAAIVLAAEPSDLDGVAAVFPYPIYENLDAVSAAAASTAPLMFVAAEGSNGGGEGAIELAAATGSSEATILSERPPAALSGDHFAPKVVRVVLEFVNSTT